MPDEKRKYEKVKTTELLDFVAEVIPYTKDKERDKQEDYKNELEQREPFSDMKRKIDNMDNQLRQLKGAMAKMMHHKHDNEGKVVIPVEHTIEERYY